ncbi:hypothetical protein TPL01_10510 [Sulfuriferula plumbiphila]|uniref:Uncharacterized protein n=1 Tax=Sulfuriferula plumbiphila TaxID=171865 RepID=A0A512L610_9PROT|nr:hypothetical protein SFPGR_25920 [Sulfuriferula plumbiphila]GEP29913.1 hypothetical protein TPL01_10510 [Sulfuriferula plumbiphila]
MGSAQGLQGGLVAALTEDGIQIRYVQVAKWEQAEQSLHHGFGSARLAQSGLQGEVLVPESGASAYHLAAHQVQNRNQL